MTKEEKAAYRKGYQAGVKRKRLMIEASVRERKRNALWNRAFITVLPMAMTVDGWTFGGANKRPIKTTIDRMELAARWADHALANHLRENT